MREHTASAYQKWSSKDFRPQERYDAWQESLNASHLSWNLHRNKEKGFTADIEMGGLNDLQVVRCICGECSGFRSSHEI
ncbi:MAG: hypothetical protein ABIJ86_08355, partial [Spirochaetota bacterium]